MLLALAALFLAGEAAAYVPSSAVVAGELARANRKAGRAHSLVLSVALNDANGRTIARGELATDPGGMARLELDGSGRRVRHLLRGGEHLAAADGQLIGQPAPYLAPLFLLQAASGPRIGSSLASLGGARGETVLGRHEGEVCWVLGGRDLPPPANDSASRAGSSGRKASVWVTREGSRVVRIDRLDGTRYVLGPEVAFQGVRLPRYIRVERPGVPAARLEVLGARRGRFDAATTFGMEWLLGR